MSAHALVVERPTRTSLRSLRGLAGGGLLSTAMVASGLLAYAFNVFVARVLGPDAYGQIAVLWGAMFLAAVVLFRPLEQTISRSMADRLARGVETRSVLVSVGALGAILLAACTAAIVLLWGPLTDKLFLGDGVLTAALLGGIVAYGLSYLLRGVFGGMRWFGGYSLALLVDGVTRIAIAAALLVIASKSVAAAAVAAGGVAAVVVPALAGRRRFRELGAGSAGAFDLKRAFGFAAPASAIAASDQFLINGAPLLVIVGGGPDASKAAGIVFAATMMVRVPVFLFQGLAASLLPNLTHMHTAGDWQGFRATVARLGGLMLALGALLSVGAVAIGPPMLRGLFGAEFAASRMNLMLLAAGVGCYLAASVASQSLLALGRAASAAVGWVIAAVTFAVAYVALGGPPLDRASGAFLAAALVNLVVLAGITAKAVRR